MSLISVIVPVYNVEKYLGKCLDSLINQTFKDIEIICVNDGSTDNSASILEKYAAKDSRIKIINKPNGGLSSARNAGLEIASSKWISFIDSDDWLDINTFEKISDVLDDKNDIICFGTHLQGKTKLSIAVSDKKYYKIKHNGYKILTDKERLTTDVATWNKIYKKEIIDKYNLRFPVGKHYEDYPFYWQYMFMAQTAFYIKEKYYNYLRRHNSIMANTFNGESNKIIDHLYASENILNFLKENNILNSHIDTFVEIFINCFLFVYKNSHKKYKKDVLKVATDLLNKFNLDEDFYTKDFVINCLKEKQYDKIFNNSQLSFVEKLFSIKNIYKTNGKIYKVIHFFGIKFSIRNKKKERKIQAERENFIY